MDKAKGLISESDYVEMSKEFVADRDRLEKAVAVDLRFDPESRYPENLIRLDLGKPNAEWGILTTDDQRRRDQ